MASTVEELLREARERLGRASFEPSPREAALLLGHVLGLGEAQVLARSERPVEDSRRRQFLALLERRLGGEPFAYLTGEREFYGRPFRVDPRVLIPRPESEHLVDEALALAPELPARPRILDLGTGSGCLAITLALELEASVVAVDLSPAALAVAAANRRRHGVAGRVELVAADLASPLDVSGFHLVVSNPPYIERHEIPHISPEVTEFEPGIALFPPAGGKAFLRRLLAGLERLVPGVPLLLEIGYRQGPEVAALLQGSPFELDLIRPDYGGRPRVARAHRT